MDFDYPKVNGDKFILDGLVYVAKTRECFLEDCPNNKKRDKETLETLILYNIVRLIASGDAKCFYESNGTFTFFIIFN